jgi:hypothetical protein
MNTYFKSAISAMSIITLFPFLYAITIVEKTTTVNYSYKVYTLLTPLLFGLVNMIVLFFKRRFRLKQTTVDFATPLMSFTVSRLTAYFTHAYNFTTMQEIQYTVILALVHFWTWGFMVPLLTSIVQSENHSTRDRNVCSRSYIKMFIVGSNYFTLLPLIVLLLINDSTGLLQQSSTYEKWSLLFPVVFGGINAISLWVFHWSHHPDINRNTAIFIVLSLFLNIYIYSSYYYTFDVMQQFTYSAALVGTQFVTWKIVVPIMNSFVH